MSSRLKKTSLSFVLLATLSLSACAQTKDLFDPQKHDFIDREKGLSRDDYRNMAKPKVDTSKLGDMKPRYEGEVTPDAKLGIPPIPPVSEILATPRPPEIGNKQLVSLFVTDDVPLKDVLIELARLANVDVEVDPAIEGGINFRAQNRPFNEVVNRIADLSGLRYSMKGNVLKVERDTPYVETYPLDFLSFDRSSTSDVNIATSVLSASGGGSGGLNSGSSAAVAYAAESDFWKQLGSAIESILGYTQASGLSQVQDESAATAADAKDTTAETFYVVNRQGGTLTVSGTKKQHQLIAQYLAKLHEETAAQVLIEAKIIEVQLNDRFQSGVNWNNVFSSKYLTLDTDNGGAANPLPDFSTPGFTQLILGGKGVDDPSLDAIVNLTQGFGTARTLSSPRIHAMNNQQAVLTFAQNYLYFKVDVQRETDTTSGGTVSNFTVSSTPVTVPIGIIISLQPSINVKTGEITLSVRPTLSNVVSDKLDPAVAFLIAANPEITNLPENKVPQIQVRELDSMMRMRSGQVMVLGGLMQQDSKNEEVGIPGAAGLPWVGNLFKGMDKHNSTSELFILIKATIVGNGSDLHPADKTIYEKFTTDHRPLAF